MRKDLNIDDILLDHFSKDDDENNFTIIDAELDPIKCNNVIEDVIEIDTTNLTYISLSSENLLQLLDKIK